MNRIIRGWSAADSTAVRHIIDTTLRQYGTTIFLDSLADVVHDRAVVEENTPFWRYFADRLSRINFSGPVCEGVD